MNEQELPQLPELSDEEVKRIIKETQEKLSTEFQTETSFELFNKLFELGKEARERFGEIAIANFLIDFAYHYRSRKFEAEARQNRILAAVREQQLAQAFNNLLLQNSEKTVEECYDEIIDNIDFNKLPEN